MSLPHRNPIGFYDSKADGFLGSLSHTDAAMEQIGPQRELVFVVSTSAWPPGIQNPSVLSYDNPAISAAMSTCKAQRHGSKSTNLVHGGVLCNELLRLVAETSWNPGRSNGQKLEERRQEMFTGQLSSHCNNWMTSDPPRIPMLSRS